MLLDIKLEQKRGMSCEEAGLASVALWLKRRYEMMFSQCWNFKLIPEDPEYPGVVGRRILVERGDPFQLFEQYHGIRTTSHELSRSDEIFQIASRELQAGLPIAVIFDYTYLECIPERKKRGSFLEFPFLVVGIDPRKKGVHCLDIHFLKKVIFLTFDNFLEGYNGYMTFSVVGPEKEVDWRDIIKYNTAGLIENNSFNSLRELAGLICDSLDFTTEQKRFYDSYGPVLSERIERIYSSRLNFSQTLSYLVDYQQAALLNEFQDQFVKLSTQWLAAWGILTMAFQQQEFKFQRDFQAQMKRVSHKIIELAAKEEEFCNTLLQALDGNLAPLNSLNSKKKVIAVKDIQEFQPVDISGYVNNEAFATGINPDITANFTGSGQFFLTEGLPKTELWQVAGLKFQFPVPADGKLDNIACLGQSLGFPKDNYSGIMFLACADWGHQFETMNVYYTEGKVESVTLEIPDWAYDSSFGDKVLAWEGKCAERINNVISPVTVYKGHLFALLIPLNQDLQFDRIQLPDCPNIHLFAITLGK